MTDWKKETYSLGWLRLRAYNRSDRSVESFLRGVGVIPADANCNRAGTPGEVAAPTSKAITGAYLAGFAKDWDDIGPSSPTEFVAALELELADSPKRDAVSDILSSLGAVLADPDFAAAAA